MNRPISLLLAATVLLGGGPALAADALTPRDLNHGYAQLRSIAGTLDFSGKLLLVKLESDAAEAYMKDVSESMEDVANALEELARADPRVKLEDDGLPPIEQRTRKAVTDDLVYSVRPVAGMTGRAWERAFILSHAGT